MARRVDFHVVEAAVWDAIDQFRARDQLLVALDAAEWSVAHRLAVYLERSFPSWNVDCEYNRQGDSGQPKRINVGSDLARPDITIHRRSLLLPEDNVLVIELKRDSSGNDDDHRKLVALTSRPAAVNAVQYQFGLALVLGAETRMSWFADGRPFSVAPNASRAGLDCLLSNPRG